MSGWPRMVSAIVARFGRCVVSAMTPPDPEVVYAEVALPADTDVSGYGIHPALLDAALHPLAAVVFDARRCRLRARGAAASVRVYRDQLARHRGHPAARPTHRAPARTPSGCMPPIPTGAPVISIDTVTLRALPDTIGQPAAVAGLGDSLLELAWSPLPEATRRGSGRAGVGGVHRGSRSAAGRPARRPDPYRSGPPRLAAPIW